MRSDDIKIDNKGNGFSDAIFVTQKMAEIQGLNHKESLHLQLFAEEMLSMARSITGELEAEFFVDADGKKFALNMSTNTVMSKEKRDLLLSASSSRKNDAANTFLGVLRDAFEEAMLDTGDKTCYALPNDIASDITGRYIENDEWDRYESSILLKLVDDVRIAIKGKKVCMTVTKDFT